MKITYLGTAAAEGFPGMFCSCETCEKARQKGGKNIRTRSQAQIDGDLLVDFPADTYMHVLHSGLDLRTIKNILITHSHDDHLYPRDLQYRRFGFAYFDEDDEVPTVPVYSSKATGEVILEDFTKSGLDKSELYMWREVPVFEPFPVGDYTVTALLAQHDIKTDPRLYIIQKDGKAILYGNDTGWYPDETWAYLKSAKPRFDFCSLDCTTILQESRKGHMGIAACEDVRTEFYKIGVADKDTKFCLHHFSHNGRLIYDELKELADTKGFLVSYDGAVFEV